MMIIRALIILSVLMLSSCIFNGSTVKDSAPRTKINASLIPNAKPRYLPRSKYGNPPSYVALGKRYYVLRSAKGYDRRGIASWYGTKFHGQLTSSREPYNMYAMTAASPVLPLPTFVRVTNLENHRSVIVKVNDRGPFAANRIIDLSYAAASKLGYANKGTALVEVAAIDVNNPNATPTPMLNHPPELYLQLGAFSEWQNAARLKVRVAHYTNKPIRIERGYARTGHPVFRVQVGPLRGVGESDRVQANLSHAGLGDALTIIG